MDAAGFILICLAGWMNNNQQDVIEYLREEVRVLKEHLGAKRVRFTDEQRGRLARKAKKIRLGKLKEMAAIVTPQTLLAWQRRLIAKKYDSSSKRVGRPRTQVSITELMVRLAQENRAWGYRSIDGALLNLGHDLGRSPIAGVLNKAGIEPAPRRKLGMTWTEFLKSPTLNSLAERWVRTVKEWCVDRMMFLGERSLRHALAETKSCYNRQRPHQALENRIIQPEFKSEVTGGKIACRSRLGGMLNYYYPEAA